MGSGRGAHPSAGRLLTARGQAMRPGTRGAYFYLHRRAALCGGSITRSEMAHSRGSASPSVPVVTSTEAKAVHPARGGLMLGALGVVFGDIGKSPIYAFRESIKAGNYSGDPNVVFGILSLVFWVFNDTATAEIYPLSLHDALPS